MCQNPICEEECTCTNIDNDGIGMNNVLTIARWIWFLKQVYSEGTYSWTNSTAPRTAQVRKVAIAH